jgi:N-acetylmuramoyl-L-alanine amidase
MQQQEGTLPDGYVFDAATALQDSETLGLLLATLDGAQPPVLLGYTPNSQLSVAYPQDGAVLTSASCFVMGTSDSALPLLLNGQPVERTAAGGTFGVLVPLELGQNTLVFSQGGEEIVLTVTRKAASSGTSSGTLPHDSTVEVEPGTMVQVSGWLASLLYNPSSDGNINETVRQGAVASVQACVETVRSGKRTWAYQLASGDYILAYNTTVLSADTPRAQLNSAAAQANGTRGEVLAFSGSGTPLAYTNQVDNTLVLHFYDADFAADFAVTGSAMIKAVSTAPLPDNAGAELVLTFDAPLWGHTLEYQDGNVVLYLKAAPTRAQNPAQPLAGVTVLLDAGHGEDDTGAMGAAGNSAPTEKDVNLAVALAARYRLEQLGATVEMIRTDDTFLSLAARNAKITELQPDFFIAVHHNSIELTADANASGGTECYYFYPSGKELATTLCERVTQATNRTNRGAQWGYYYVTRNTTCPAVLLEVGFMVNPAEYESVTDEATLWRTGAAIAHSVLNCVPQA